MHMAYSAKTLVVWSDEACDGKMFIYPADDIAAPEFCVS